MHFNLFSDPFYVNTTVDLDQFITTMLKARAVGDLLAQATYGGVESTMLLSTDGSLLSFQGESILRAKTIAAVVSNIWFAYDRHAQLSPPTLHANSHNELSTFQDTGALRPVSAETPVALDSHESGQQELIIECEEGLIVIHAVRQKVLLCCVCALSCDLGCVKSKMRAILKPLKAAFSHFSV
ncbi:Ragulator complex protein lamtor2 [Batrachochytrium dendrobatidis]|nr:Ragulator complex protein lamtor2 [Batrachochytrium dendrobatidis]KAK5673430.1 Ragulator complex protein lamtor2 [Batrachochytrium dendrobatidis]OAJ39895.1 hypothetical protein BDEG_23693 [Batrachochytrium dendrobatidis JEL423]